MRYILIALLLSSCCSKSFIIGHVPLDEIKQPTYIQLIDIEKSCLIDSAVDKIHANKTACQEQIKEFNAIIQQHNEIHNN